MKNMVIGIVLTIISVLLLGSGMTISGRNVRQNELDRTLERAVRQTVGELRKNTGGIESDSQLAADAAERILMGIGSAGDIEVSIMKCDAEKGILLVRAKENYKHINGKTGTVTSERLVILEEYDEI